MRIYAELFDLLLFFRDLLILLARALDRMFSPTAAGVTQW